MEVQAGDDGRLQLAGLGVGGGVLHVFGGLHLGLFAAAVGGLDLQLDLGPGPDPEVRGRRGHRQKMERPPEGLRLLRGWARRLQGLGPFRWNFKTR